MPSFDDVVMCQLLFNEWLMRPALVPEGVQLFVLSIALSFCLRPGPNSNLWQRIDSVEIDAFNKRKSIITFLAFLKTTALAGWLSWRIVLMCQACGFNSWSGHIQESTNECLNGWTSKSVSVFLPPPFSLFLSLSQINKFKKWKTTK